MKPKYRILVAVLLGFAASALAAQVGYRLQVTTGFTWNRDPFPNEISNNHVPGDTGWIQILNAGSTTFVGHVGDVAISNFAGDLGFDSGLITLAPGQSVSYSIANNTSPLQDDAGGFNGPFGKIQPGVQVYLTGTINGTETVALSVFDKDIHSGVPRHSPSDHIMTDAYLLQGGSPTGGDNGDGFELSQGFGHFSFFENAAAAPLRFVPIPPCRSYDTRRSSPIAPGASRDFVIPGTCGVPVTAGAYSLNVTVVPRGSLGDLTVWPTGQVQPSVSTLNSLDGRTKSNAAIVPAGNNRAITVLSSPASSAPTDVMLDINGYFVNDPSALAFYPLPPCRVADTRHTNGPLGGPYLRSRIPRTFPVLASSCNVPSNAQAYSLNITALPRLGLRSLTVWPSGQSQPSASTLSAKPAQVTSNAAIVPAGTGGDIKVIATDDSNLLIDINGYFAPPASGGLSLYAASPCRTFDTRTQNGAFSGTLVVNVVSGPCGVPSAAQAFVLNATVVPTQGRLDSLTLWPDGLQQPVVSTLSARDGMVTSNMVVVPTTNGSIDIFATNPTQLILDFFGYFAP